jgi:hypothetical protein
VYADTPDRRLTNYTVVIRFRQVEISRVSRNARELRLNAHLLRDNRA